MGRSRQLGTCGTFTRTSSDVNGVTSQRLECPDARYTPHCITTLVFASWLDGVPRAWGFCVGNLTRSGGSRPPWGVPKTSVNAPMTALDPCNHLLPPPSALPVVALDRTVFLPTPFSDRLVQRSAGVYSTALVLADECLPACAVLACLDQQPQEMLVWSSAIPRALTPTHATVWSSLASCHPCPNRRGGGCDCGLSLHGDILSATRFLRLAIDSSLAEN